MYYRLIVALVVEASTDLVFREQRLYVIKLRLKEYTLIDNRVSLLRGRKHKNKGQEGAGTFLCTSCVDSLEQLNSSKLIQVLFSEEYYKFLIL